MSRRRHRSDGAGAPEKGAFRVERDDRADRVELQVRGILEGPDDGYAPFVELSMHGAAGEITDVMMPSEAFELAQSLMIAAVTSMSDCALALAGMRADMNGEHIHQLVHHNNDTRNRLLDLARSETAIAWLEFNYPEIGAQLIAQMTEESNA